ncbi:8427_t:CDS:2 [Acaulospora morrowiae]|uniref:8427_t:CDS:1 n=1 Tax=Acaulospora morrowiae TaxID=94023 RepID=A0A9N9NKN7_9GLOM|nr:8427_t:CDS:2 [Acaulospora morrowiae]
MTTLTTLEIELYNSQTQRWPSSGKHILAQFNDNSIVIYQAFNNSIADYAVKNQKFGGDDYSWSGWATKKNQERILAIRLSLQGFLTILSECVPSTFKASSYTDEKSWKDALKDSNIRLQWDPDHNLSGGRLPRRAIQLGISGEDLVRRYSNEWILSIEDITEFVKEQYDFVKEGKFEMVWTPKERIFEITDERIRNNLGMDLSDA